MAQEMLGSGNAGARMPDISLALRSVNWNYVCSEDFAQKTYQFVQREAYTCSNVQHSSGRDLAACARKIASTASATKVKSRVCSPSPNIVGLTPSAMLRTNRGITAA